MTVLFECAAVAGPGRAGRGVVCVLFGLPACACDLSSASAAQSSCYLSRRGTIVLRRGTGVRMPGSGMPEAANV